MNLGGAASASRLASDGDQPERESHRFPPPISTSAFSSDDVARCLTLSEIETLDPSFEYRTYKLSCSAKEAFFSIWRIRRHAWSVQISSRTQEGLKKAVTKAQKKDGKKRKRSRKRELFHLRV